MTDSGSGGSRGAPQARGFDDERENSWEAASHSVRVWTCAPCAACSARTVISLAGFSCAGTMQSSSLPPLPAFSPPWPGKRPSSVRAAATRKRMVGR